MKLCADKENLIDSESDLDDCDNTAISHICGSSVDNNYREVTFVNNTKEADSNAKNVSLF